MKPIRDYPEEQVTGICLNDIINGYIYDGKPEAFWPSVRYEKGKD